MFRWCAGWIGGRPGDGKACAAAGKPGGRLLVGEGGERSRDTPVSRGGQDPHGAVLSPVPQPAEALAPLHGGPLGGLEVVFFLSPPSSCAMSVVEKAEFQLRPVWYSLPSLCGVLGGP